MGTEGLEDANPQHGQRSKCLRFGLWLTLCTLNILFTYLLMIRGEILWKPDTNTIWHLQLTNALFKQYSILFIGK